MKTQNNNALLPKKMLPIIVFSLFSCINMQATAAEKTDNEAAMIATEEPSSEPANEAQNDANMDTNSEQAVMAESSGISPPVEKSTVTEAQPAADEMPMAETTVNENTMSAAAGISYSSIMEIPADYYAVQVVATSSMQNLNNFAQKHHLSNNLSTQIEVQGKTWNILLSGAYPTRKEARAAIADFRGKLSTSPWIRPVKTLQ
ncbi:MAG: SPOR domain-containing protein [Gammaproteobacteria bacterium]|nr:SPOR domain-containing protein [Gammaproteobacteria bacterium]